MTQPWGAPPTERRDPVVLLCRAELVFTALAAFIAFLSVSIAMFVGIWIGLLEFTSALAFGAAAWITRHAVRLLCEPYD
jgi:hypothetical protein